MSQMQVCECAIKLQEGKGTEPPSAPGDDKDHLPTHCERRPVVLLGKSKRRQRRCTLRHSSSQQQCTQQQLSSREGALMMGVSYRCTTVAILVTLGLLSESQAFAFLSNGGSSAVLRSSTKAGNMMLACSSSPRRHYSSTSTARVGGRRKAALMMSEMTEDYPSDTGDDRFSPGGKLGGYIIQAEKQRAACVCVCLLLHTLPTQPTQRQLLFVARAELDQRCVRLQHRVPPPSCMECHERCCCSGILILPTAQ